MGKATRKLSDSQKPTLGRFNGEPEPKAHTNDMRDDERTEQLVKSSSVLKQIADMARFYSRRCGTCGAKWFMAMDRELVFMKGETLCIKCGSKVTGTIATDKDDVKIEDPRQSSLAV